MSLGDYIVIGPLCYQGKKDCDSSICTRSGYTQREDGTWDMGECRGHHCSYCDEPCSMMGHRCPASQAILGEAERVLREEGRIP